MIRPPEQWQLKRHEQWCYVVDTADGSMVCRMAEASEQAERNAQLIAGAPKLARATKMLLDALKTDRTLSLAAHTWFSPEDKQFILSAYEEATGKTANF